MSKYAEMLKDPRWQRKRLEVLERENFTCQECWATEKTLHVHHMYYEKGLKPWEYPDESLHCLCERCHERIGKKQADLARAMSRLSSSDIDQMVGYARGLASERYDREADEIVRFPIRCENAEQLQGMQDAICHFMTPDEEERILDYETGAVNTAALRELATRRMGDIWEFVRSAMRRVA